MGRLTWSEIRAQQTGNQHKRHKKHHSQTLDSVCPAARERFNNLGLDGVFEEYFRFRLGGEKRLWGFAVEGVFYVLWWDAKHKVCPTEKRHT